MKQDEASSGGRCPAGNLTAEPQDLEKVAETNRCIFTVTQSLGKQLRPNTEGQRGPLSLDFTFSMDLRFRLRSCLFEIH